MVSPSEAVDLEAVAAFEGDRMQSIRQTASLPSDAPVVARLRRSVADFFGLGVEFVEPPRLVQYSKAGDTFEPHVDWIVDERDAQLGLLGQRVATGLVYLGDLPPGAGGTTAFPRLGLDVAPEAGAALLWPNVDAQGQPLWSVEHEARPLTRDGITKLAVNVWVRDRPLPTDPAVLESLYLS